MKNTRKATSIVEAIIVLLVVVTGIVGVYEILASSQKLTNTTANRIEAISIARDALEGFHNIRDTNWQLFAADKINCWNVLNYNPGCIGNMGVDLDIRDIANRAYTISKNTNNQFELTSRDNTGNYSLTRYRDNFRVRKDALGFYTQESGIESFPIYTREIRINYLNADDTPGDSNAPKMQITVLVQWSDSSSSSPKRLEMSTRLTNWRAEK